MPFPHLGRVVGAHYFRQWRASSLSLHGGVIEGDKRDDALENVQVDASADMSPVMLHSSINFCPGSQPCRSLQIITACFRGVIILEMEIQMEMDCGAMVKFASTFTRTTTHH